jgi:succinate dehydrogenase / fumarate reductase membrane anchor subunit
MVGYLVANPDLTYVQWVQLNQNNWMRIFTLFTALSIAAHAWIGLWSVLTDYITVRLMGPKAVPLRIVLELGMIVLILAYVVWAIDILWGI